MGGFLCHVPQGAVPLPSAKILVIGWGDILIKSKVSLLLETL